MRLHAWWTVVLMGPAVACASNPAPAKTPAAATPTRRVDLKAARAAVDEARKAGAPTRAPETFKQAESHLKEAEGLAGRGSAVAAEKAQRAEFLGLLAATEARCATNLVRVQAGGDKAGSADKGRGDAATRLRRAEEERRRLDEKVALLQRELELTEMEVVRTKARLQGLETKAEASSAIAEARILMGRLDARDRATLARCQELLDKAEQQIAENNFGAAVFFARKAQEIATRAGEPVGGPTQP